MTVSVCVTETLILFWILMTISSNSEGVCVWCFGQVELRPAFYPLVDCLSLSVRYNRLELSSCPLNTLLPTLWGFCNIVPGANGYWMSQCNLRKLQNPARMDPVTLSHETSPTVHAPSNWYAHRRPNSASALSSVGQSDANEFMSVEARIFVMICFAFLVIFLSNYTAAVASD